MSNAIATLTAADFEPLNGEEFRLTAAGSELALKLAEVRRSGEAVRVGGAFSVLFTTPEGPSLPQAIYPVTHPALGTLDVFVVPLGPKGGVNRYEVILPSEPAFQDRLIILGSFRQTSPKIVYRKYDCL
jgi:hypothetical protein